MAPSSASPAAVTPENLPNRLIMYAIAAYFFVKFLHGAWMLVEKWRGTVPVPVPAPGPAPAHVPVPVLGPITDPAHVPYPNPDGLPDAAAPAPAAVPVPVPADLKNFQLLGFAVLAVLLAVVFFAPASLDGADADDESATHSLGPVHMAHIGALPVPYYLRPFFLDTNKNQIPIVDCAFHMYSEHIQNAELGEMPEQKHVLAPADIDAGIGAELKQQQIRQQTERMDLLLRRRKALQRCGLNVASLHETASAAPSFEAHETRPPFWNTGAAVLAGDTRASSVIVARNGSRYFSVAAVRQVAGSSSYRLVPALVSERDLLLAADRWFRRLTELSGASASHAHCLCVAHFGIVNSGLHFSYDTKASRWRMRVGLEITFNESFVEDTTTMMWLNRQLMFPAGADGHYHVENLTYSSKVMVRYYDTTSFSDDAFLRAAREIESTWASDGVSESTSPFAIVVPFRALAPVHRRVEVTEENACMQHCLAVDRVCADRLQQKMR